MNNHTFIIAGNCVFHCLRDQLRTVLHMDVPSDPLEFRLKVILSIQQNRHLMNHSDLTVDQWIAKNCINKIHVSHLALQLVANLYKIKIIVYQLFHEDGITEIIPLEEHGVVNHVGEVNLLHLSEIRFYNGHYLSIKHIGKSINFNIK